MTAKRMRAMGFTSLSAMTRASANTKTAANGKSRAFKNIAMVGSIGQV